MDKLASWIPDNGHAKARKQQRVTAKSPEPLKRPFSALLCPLAYFCTTELCFSCNLRTARLLQPSSEKTHLSEHCSLQWHWRLLQDQQKNGQIFIIRIHVPSYAFKHCFYSLILHKQSHSLQSVKYLAVKQKYSHKCMLPWSPRRCIYKPLDLQSVNFFSSYTD